MNRYSNVMKDKSMSMTYRCTCDVCGRTEEIEQPAHLKKWVIGQSLIGSIHACSPNNHIDDWAVATLLAKPHNKFDSVAVCSGECFDVMYEAIAAAQEAAIKALHEAYNNRLKPPLVQLVENVNLPT